MKKSLPLFDNIWSGVISLENPNTVLLLHRQVVLPLRTPETELFQKSLWTVTVWSSMLSQLVIAVDRYCCVTKSARGEGGSARVTYSHRSRWGSNKRKR